MENNTKHTGWIIGAIILVITAFFVGKSYGASHATPSTTATAGNYRTGSFAGRTSGGGMTIGQVVAMDATSITISMPIGGSKIVLYTPTTTVSKTVSGAISDVAVGSTVSVTGTANSDGSVTASEIQIRPVGFGKPAATTNGLMQPATPSATQ